MAAYPLLVDTYREICGDVAAFSAACQRPLPTTAWHAAGLESAYDRGSAGASVPDTLQGLKPVPWRAGAYRFPIGNASHDFMVQYLLGMWHIQEEAAMLAVHLLAPAPGDHVLDMCAAPGNKTAELALAAGPEGFVVAADRSGERLGVVQTTMNRLGLTNVATLVADGGAFPAADNTFDLVLVDAPCSAEGTCRRHPDILHDSQRLGRAGHSMLRGSQVRLLTEAARLVRPGGRIAYATCTFSPEENEGVVSDVLGARGDVRVVEPRPVPELVLREGIPSWQGERFHADVRHARRLWPHDNDTGGFFVCILEKTGRAAAHLQHTVVKPVSQALAADDIPWSVLDVPADVLMRWRMCHNRLVSAGLAPHIQPGLGMFSGTGTGGSTDPGRSIAPEPSTAVRLSYGVRLFNPKTRDHRLTTEAARTVGPFAQNGTVDIAPEAVTDYLVRRPVQPEALSPAAPHIPVVIVRCRGAALGLGRVRGGRVESLFPRIWGGVDVQRSLNRNDITPV